MPEVKPERIISFSSEDKAYPADNLLRVGPCSRWKCQRAGSSFESVTFRFASPIQFNRLDIGNDASAFIMVEVSRADCSDFEVLLPSSSFMSVADARKAVSLSNVRIFSCNELIPTIASQKWDTVRVICTQPFNKEIQYGLTFIRFYSAAELRDVAPVTETEEKNVSNTEVDETLKPGGLFKFAKRNSETKGITPGMDSGNTYTVSPATVMVTKKANIPTIVTTSTTPLPSTSTVLHMSSVTDRNAQEDRVRSPLMSRKGQGILAGVIVAFSGYKNPFRSELRNLCLRLGAKWRNDWTDDCTHLICAFPNTPKWNAVRGKGIIVSHKWIQACNSANRRVSWRPYRVGRAPSPIGQVSDYAMDYKRDDDSDWEKSLVEGVDSDEWRPDTSEESDDSSESNASTKAEYGKSGIASGATDKLFPKGRQRTDCAVLPYFNTPQANEGDGGIDRDIQGGSGSITCSSQNTGPFPHRSDIFVGKRFYIFSKDFNVKEEEIVHRLIITLGGKVELRMNTGVDFVVSRSAWCEDFDKALEVHPSLAFVRPEWIYACDELGKLVPFQRYQIVT